MPLLLPLVILLPLIGALWIALLPANRSRMAPYLAVTASGMALLASLALAIGLDFQGGVQHAIALPWMPALGAGLRLGVDGMRWLLLVTSGMIALSAILLSLPLERVRPYFALLLGVQAAASLAFAAQDLLLYFCGWQIALFGLYLLSSQWGGAHREHASTKAMLFWAGGGGLTLVALVVLSLLNGTSTELATLLQNHPAAVAPIELQRLIFLGFVTGFAVQLPLPPFHSWWSDWASEAPLPVTALATGTVLPLAAFGLVVLAPGIMPGPARDLAPLLTWLGVLSALYGAWGAIAQRRLDRAIAFVGMSLAGFVMASMGVFTAESLRGSLATLVIHPLVLAFVFLGAHVLAARAKSLNLEDLAGLARQTPLLRVVPGGAVVLTFLLLVAPRVFRLLIHHLAVGLPLLASLVVCTVTMSRFSRRLLLEDGKTAASEVARRELLEKAGVGVPELDTAEKVGLGLLLLVSLVLVPLVQDLPAVSGFAGHFLPLLGL